MGCELVTGVAGHPHIDGDDIASLLTGLIGPDDCVLATSEGLPARMETSNTLSLGTGDLLMQGRHVRFASSSTVGVESGTPGMKRNDLLVCRYMKASDGVETASLVVLKGAPTSGTPQDPAWEHGRIIEGATIADMPLYRIPLDGITVHALQPVFTTMKPVSAGDVPTLHLVPFNEWCQSLDENKGRITIIEDMSWLMVYGPIAILQIYANFASPLKYTDEDICYLKPPYRPLASYLYTVGSGDASATGYKVPEAVRITHDGLNGRVIITRHNPSVSINNLVFTVCYPLDSTAQAAS